MIQIRARASIGIAPKRAWFDSRTHVAVGFQGAEGERRRGDSAAAEARGRGFGARHQRRADGEDHASQTRRRQPCPSRRPGQQADPGLGSPAEELDRHEDGRGDRVSRPQGRERLSTSRCAGGASRPPPRRPGRRRPRRSAFSPRRRFSMISSSRSMWRSRLRRARSFPPAWARRFCRWSFSSRASRA